MGQGAEEDLIRGRLEGSWPGLKAGAYEVTSLQDHRYNCVAWVLGKNTEWWEPYDSDECYWPAGAPQDVGLADYVALFQGEGFSAMENLDLGVDPEVEKIMLYANRYDRFSHVARQVEGGRWTSKLGDWEDIAHEHPDVLQTADWVPKVVMIRPRVGS